MKKLSRLKFDENVTVLSDQEMKMMKGGGSGLTYYYCNDNSEHIIPYGSCYQGEGYNAYSNNVTSDPYVGCLCYST